MSNILGFQYDMSCSRYSDAVMVPTGAPGRYQPGIQQSSSCSSLDQIEGTRSEPERVYKCNTTN